VRYYTQLIRYQRLLLAAGDADRQSFAALIIHLGVPPDLSYLLDGLRRTSEILEAQVQNFDQLLGLVKGYWSDTAAVLVAVERLKAFVEDWAPSRMDAVRLPMARKSGGQRHPLHGYCMLMCPLWANLFCEPPPESAPQLHSAYADIHRQVTLYIIALQVRERDESFLSQYEHWAKEQKQPNQGEGTAPSRISSASLALRRLSDPAYAFVLDALSAPADTLRARIDEASYRLFPAHEAQAREAPAGDDDRDPAVLRILDALRLLEEELFERSSRTPGAKGGARGTRRIHLPSGYVRLAGQHLLATSDEVDEGVGVTHFFYVPQPLSKSDGKAPAMADPEDGPLGDTADRLGITLVTLPSGDSSGKNRRLVSERAAGQMRRLMSAPTHDSSSLSDWQVGRIAEVLARQNSGLGAGPQLLMRTLLATGRDPRTTKFAVRESMDALADLPAGSEPRNRAYFAREQKEWWVEVPPPAFEHSERGQVERDPSYWLVLPDLLGVYRGLDDREACRVLTNPGCQAEAFAAIDKWLDQCLWDASVRHRHVRSWLFRRLLEVCGGNPTVAVYLTGQSLAHARTTEHYTALEQSFVCSKYRAALSPLVGKGGANDENGPPGIHIGARRVPTIEAVRNLVAGMLDAISSHHGAEQLDALTAYTMLGFHLGVAGRPKETRFLDFLDRDAGLVVLEEKGTRYDRRVVALPPVIRKQMSAYETVVDSCGAQPNRATGIFVKRSAAGFPTAPFTPANFRELASRYGYDLEMYSLRRFVRTELTARGADGEDIDALMGHWYAGMSPHDPLSLYPVQRLVQFARTDVQRLLDDVGYRLPE
jgi:hypothetical protein